MRIAGSRVLITGANRGLGRAIVEAMREAGAAKIYAGTRNPAAIAPDDIVTPVRLDITDDTQCRHRVRCGDVDMLVNNAGIASFTPSVSAPPLENARREMETNYFGTLAMCRAFAPVLKEERWRRHRQYPLRRELDERADAGNLLRVEGGGVVDHESLAV